MYFFRKDLAEKRAVDVNVAQLKYMMCLNESTLDPFEQVKPQFLQLMEKIHLNRYYSEITAELQTELADYAQVMPQNIIMGNGADEMLYYLFTAVRNDDNSYAVSLSPSYFDYQSYCDATGLKIRFQSLNSDFGFDPQEFIKMASHPDCRLVILCNPNNPTGNLFAYQDLLKVISANPQRLVVVDETYYEFSGVTLIDQISTFANLVIIRTFSKGFSAAGLRFGYLIASQQNVCEIKKVVTAFNLSIFTQALALVILRNKQLFLDHNKMIISQRKHLYHLMKKLRGLQVFSSHTNFLLFQHKYSVDLFHYLFQNDIAIRNVGDAGVLKNCLRVSVSDKLMNSRFYDLLRGFCHEKI